MLSRGESRDREKLRTQKRGRFWGGEEGFVGEDTEAFFRDR